MRDEVTGQFLPKEITLTPTRNLGYFCGLVIGDGWLFASKSRNYGVALETSDVELASLFRESIKQNFPDITIFSYKRRKKRKFPNGKEYNGSTEIIIINSKRLYEALAPFKGEDFLFSIPDFLTNKESLIGFLQGLFDAEGSCSPPRKKNSNPSPQLFSKHQSNLRKVRRILKQLNIETYLYRKKYNEWVLEVKSRSLKIFKELIGFRISRKKKVLAMWKETRYCKVCGKLIISGHHH